MSAQVSQIPAIRDEDTVSGLPADYQGSLAVALSRSEIDQQITTARAMPRSIKRAVDNILTLATLDAESAEECVYALPRGGKPIKGPSVRLAEIIASQWGNCRVGARVVHVDRFEKYIEAEGVFHDLETNTATTARVRRRISDKQGRILNEDMIVVTGNAACAIAKRNAILGAVPKGVWRRAYTAVESVIAGDIKTLAERREKAMKAFAAFGVKPEQIFAALGIAGIEEIGIDHIGTLTGMHSALRSGEATVEEMFARPDAKVAPIKGLSDGLDALADKPKSGAKAETSAHDAETGEITGPGADAPDEAPANGPVQAAGAKGSPPAPAPAATYSPEEMALRGKLEPKARKGSAAYRRAKSVLSDADTALLSEEMDKELLDIADEVDAAAAIADDFPGDR